MSTACQARLLSAFSGIRLELLLHSQAGDADFCTWALKLNKILPSYPGIYSEMKGIVERGINEDQFLTSEIRLSAISSSVINYTSACEYYLVDFINLMLKDNRLLKRGLDLKNITVNKFDITEFENIEDLRNKYRNQLSGEYSRGELWTKKLSNAYRLFDIKFNKNDAVIQSIDSIWVHRNKLAHMNRNHHLPMIIQDLKGAEIEIADLSSDDNYLDYCLQLVDIMTNGLHKIQEFEQTVWKKWKE